MAFHKNITALSVEMAINWFAVSPPTSSASIFSTHLSPSQCVRVFVCVRVCLFVCLCIAENISVVSLVARRYGDAVKESISYSISFLLDTANKNCVL